MKPLSRRRVSQLPVPSDGDELWATTEAKVRKKKGPGEAKIRTLNLRRLSECRNGACLVHKHALIAHLKGFVTPSLYTYVTYIDHAHLFPNARNQSQGF